MQYRSCLVCIFTSFINLFPRYILNIITDLSSKQNELDVSQREVARLKSKQIELSKSKKSLESSVKAQKEEIKKMKGNQQYLKKQFEHDIRKGEREMAKLKEKLVQVWKNYRGKISSGIYIQ